MSAVAKPMTWLYLRISAPAAIAVVAIYGRDGLQGGRVLARHGHAGEHFNTGGDDIVGGVEPDGERRVGQGGGSLRCARAGAAAGVAVVARVSRPRLAISGGPSKKRRWARAKLASQMLGRSVRVRRPVGRMKDANQGCLGRVPIGALQ